MQVRVVEFNATTSFHEQLQTIAGTGIFISVHTSNLAKAQFLPPGAAVFEIIQRNWCWEDLDKSFQVCKPSTSCARCLRLLLSCLWYRINDSQSVHSVCGVCVCHSLYLSVCTCLSLCGCLSAGSYMHTLARVSVSADCALEACWAVSSTMMLSFLQYTITLVGWQKHCNLPVFLR